MVQHRLEPIARGGTVRISELDGLTTPLEVGIHQLQLEQDTGKSLHDMRPGHTLLDLNRAGIGLMEIVTKPDLRSSFEAGILVKKLQSILRSVGSSKANMEEGSMRCDVNVSVNRPGENFGTRCELKNLNSVRFLCMAIDAEVRRQISVIEQGGIIEAETRGYDVTADKTFKLRGKETAPDYRYMPEPDLPPLFLSSDYITHLASTLPELPDACRVRIMDQYKLSVTDANVVLNEPETTGPTGKRVLKLLVEHRSTEMPIEIVKEKGWLRMRDSGALKTTCEEIVRNNPEKAERIRSGNPKMFNWFVGQVMRETKGKADPVELNTALCEALGTKIEDMMKDVRSSGGKSSKKTKKE
ncbi:hypothetical protein DFQ29_002924 [Apophysomyces sp. BC1021]|nr:hypothetical protein DFQ29_002924 [Apophysomyces sp. BC1021]